MRGERGMGGLRKGEPNRLWIEVSGDGDSEVTEMITIIRMTTTTTTTTMTMMGLKNALLILENHYP